jgi:UDP-N-acetylmuramyl pentapeptide phosphotransferase/UDP-N-acetylglucosamine-1-phosphate transferase
VSNGLIATIIFLVTAATSVAFVSKTTDLFGRLGLVDMPGPRRVHKKPVPRGLGVAIFLAFLVGIGATYFLPVDRQPQETERILLMVIGAAIVVGVMLVDDALNLGPGTKLVWQVMAAAVVVLPRLRSEDHGIVIGQINFPFVGTVTFPILIAIVLTFIWLIGMMNVMNWVDGLDGLAGSVTLVACIVLFIHTFWGPDNVPQFTISLLPLALGAAVLGFLPFNWHPAKVVMGDAGAMFLGFALGIISIIGGAKIATALLVLGLPLLDGVWVTVYRLVNGRSPMRADMGHLHHRLLRAGLSQPQVVMVVSGVSASFGALALLLPNRELKLASFVFIGVLLLITLGVLARRSAHEQIQEEPGH